MKILSVHNYYQKPGGEDVMVEQDAKLLRAKGHEVVHYSDTNNRLATMGSVELLSSTFWNQKAFQDVGRIIAVEKIDLVHIHNYFPLLSASVFKAAQDADVPIVHTLHNYRLMCLNGLMLRDGKFCSDCLSCGNLAPGVLHKCYRESASKSAVAALATTVHRALGTVQQNVDQFIALSELGVAGLKQLGIPDKRISRHRNYLLNDHGEGDGSGNFVAFAGRLSHEKGIPTLLDAWKQLDQTINLKIAGEGLYTPEVQKAASADPSIEHLGWVSVIEVSALLSKAKLFVMTSTCAETDPIVIIQSLCGGTPAVLSDALAPSKELEKAGVAWTFKAGDPQDLARVIKLAMSTPGSELSNMRKRAREVFLRSFNSDVAYASLMRIYEQAIAHRSAR